MSDEATVEQKAFIGSIWLAVSADDLPSAYAAIVARDAAKDAEIVALRTAVDKAHEVLDASKLLPPRATSHDGLAERIQAVIARDAAKPSTSSPTVAGYWWTRPAKDCLWRVVEISIHDGRCYIQEIGEEENDTLPECPWWEWAGPIASPK